MGLFHSLQLAFEYLILGITIVILVAYVSLALLSAFSLRQYLRKNSFVDYNGTSFDF